MEPAVARLWPVPGTDRNRVFFSVDTVIAEVQPSAPSALCCDLVSNMQDADRRRIISAMADVSVRGGHLKRIPFFLAIVATLILVQAAAAAPVRLRAEYLENPLGIDKPAP